MTGEEFRSLRKTLGLTQKKFACFVGLNEQSVAIWEKKNKVPVWADKFIRMLNGEAISVAGGGNE